MDSQCLSYLIDVMFGTNEPTDALASERIALIRLYFYTPDTLYITPTVATECAKIRNADRRELHHSFCSVLFSDASIADKVLVENRWKVLFNIHAKENDCRVLSEAEDAKFSHLLTYDYKFLSRLSEKSENVLLLTPSSLWMKIGLPKKAKPDKTPEKTNPLFTETWWRW